ncbi:uncharacterized protein LOC119995440 [Tripterygium wilfordii]|uniref:uncharacterized protein LOC119995440 n=1 Tax=Tripterygium wilfordii TaxID=458696 RepID=UPI0018F7EE5F|nr:uncharacterized protein LOC119995440 [Tripterygium wilfordii]
MNDFSMIIFAENPVYPPNRFRRRFRMRRDLFLRIQSAVEAHEPFSQQKMDAAGKLGLSSLQKITTAFQMLAYGVSTNLLDEYVRIRESTAILSMKIFVKILISIFGNEYLRSPNSDDIAILLAIGESRGFPGMLGKLLQGHSPPVHYNVNDRHYLLGYYLVDGIYPSWATFVKTIPMPQTNKASHFKKLQESCRKDVERAFGVLQARFAIVRGSARYFKRSTLHDIMLACIIMHNMIIEDERHLHVQPDIADMYDQAEDGPPTPALEHLRTREFRDFIDQYIRIQDREIRTQLQADLVEHSWNIHSNA